jgi:hypothetical protein
VVRHRRNARLSVRVTETDRHLVEAVADLHGTNVGTVVRRALDRYLEDHRDVLGREPRRPVGDLGLPDDGRTRPPSLLPPKI